MTTEERKLLNDCYHELKEIKSLLRTLCNNKVPRDSSVSSNQLTKTDDLEVIVSKTLKEIGMPCHIKGYLYIRTAIVSALKDFSIMDSLSRNLYPSVAEFHNSTPSRVARGIRHAIEVTWLHENYENLSKVFGFIISRRPTNAEFLAMVIDKIKLNL